MTPPASLRLSPAEAGRLAAALSAAHLTLDRQAAHLAEEVGEPDPLRVARQRQQHGRYPTRWIGPAAARQPIPPERPSPATRADATRQQRQGRHGRTGREVGCER